MLGMVTNIVKMGRNLGYFSHGNKSPWLFCELKCLHNWQPMCN
jgi:hypothetical protein